MRKIEYIAPHIVEVALEQTGAILSGSRFEGTQSDYNYQDAWGDGGMGAGASDYDVEAL
ncbi:MAG: hypothetical protein ACI4QG_00865 [Candidatus Cryptobacteroides sp.]